LTQLTTQFPATTTAHVTTLHTGLAWASRVVRVERLRPRLDALITPLLFSFAGDSVRDALLRAGADPYVVLPSMPTLYEDLGTAGVMSAVFEPAAFAPSTFDGVLTRGARVALGRRPAVGAGRGRPMREPAAGHAYLYLGELDTVGHVHGPSSSEFAATAVRCLDALEAGLPRGRRARWCCWRQTRAGRRRSATTNFVNEAWPELTGLLARAPRPRRAGPAGSARDLFLHCRPETVDEVVAA